MHVVLETAAGEIAIEVLAECVPRTAAWFRSLVERGDYDGSAFYRSTTLAVPDGPRLIQGGPLHEALTGHASASAPSAGPSGRGELLEEIETTAHTGIRHGRGTVSLARDLLNTGFVLPELFICLGDFPQLDYGGRSEPDERGFPAFGQVTAGLDAVERIAAAETAGATPIERLRGEILTRPVAIWRVAERFDSAG